MLQHSILIVFNTRNSNSFLTPSGFDETKCFLYCQGRGELQSAYVTYNHKHPIGKFNYSSHRSNRRRQHSDVFTPYIVELKYFIAKCQKKLIESMISTNKPHSYRSFKIVGFKGLVTL